MKKMKKLMGDSSGVTHHYLLGVIVIVVLAIIGVRVFMATHASSSRCLGDPAQAIEAEPAGRTWNGGGRCYKMPGGVRITQPITIENAIFKDKDHSQPAKGSIQPIIRIQATKDVTIENITVQGGNPGGGYHAQLVNGAGIKVIASTNVHINNVTTEDTEGDGLEVFAEPPKYASPDQVVVNGLTVINAGRWGLTPVDLTSSIFDNVQIQSAALGGVDFESDIKGLGAGHVLFVNSSLRGIVLSETITGPVEFQNCTFAGQIQSYLNASPYPIQFTGGSFAMTHKAVPGILIRNAGTLDFTNVSFSRQPGNQPGKGPFWSVIRGGTLNLVHSPAPSPQGIKDATSTVNITP